MALFDVLSVPCDMFLPWLSIAFRSVRQNQKVGVLEDVSEECQGKPGGETRPGFLLWGL